MPLSRTLTAVHDAILDDLVYPHEIIGKRIRYRHDGSRLLKVHLHADTKAAQDKVCEAWRRNGDILKRWIPLGQTFLLPFSSWLPSLNPLSQLDVYIKVYKKMTGKDVAFEYRV